MINTLRKDIRLKHYDYSSAGFYYITICTKNRLHLFGKIINGKMHYSKHGIIAKDELINMPSHYKNISLDNYIIMPDHIHMIIIVESETKNKGAPPMQVIGAPPVRDVVQPPVRDIAPPLGQDTAPLAAPPAAPHAAPPAAPPATPTAAPPVRAPLAAPVSVCETDTPERDVATPAAPVSVCETDTQGRDLGTLVGRASAPPTIGNIIRGYKSAVSRKIGFSVWLRNYYDHIIRSEEDYFRIWQYIDENPAKWQNDCHSTGNRSERC